MTRPATTLPGAFAAFLVLGMMMALPATPTPRPGPTLADPMDHDGLIYLIPTDQDRPIAPSRKGEVTRHRRPRPSVPPTPAEITMTPYGEPDGLVANSNGFLAVRFDPPFEAPYTITGISFPSRTQHRTTPGRLISVRILGMDPLTGLPDKPGAVPCIANGTRTLTRTTGSFLYDGVRVGDVVQGGAGTRQGTVVTHVDVASLTASQVIGPDPTGEPQVREFVPPIHHELRRVAVSATGETNTIPLHIPGPRGRSLFVVFHFPPPPASADSFPFLYTDRMLTDRGLFAASFASDTSGRVRHPLIRGTRGRTIECLVDSSDIVGRASGSFLDDGVNVGDLVSGNVPQGTRVVSVGATWFKASSAVPRPKTAGPPAKLGASLEFSPKDANGLLLDQNLVCAMFFRLEGTAPLPAPSAVGLDLGDQRASWTFIQSDDVLADGTPAPRNFLVANELVRRQNNEWRVVATVGAGMDRVILPRVPGSGFQVWGVRSVDRWGGRSEVSSVTLSGATNVQACLLPAGEDAQEPNGAARFGEPTPLAPPVSESRNTIWPAGDVDRFTVEARPGREISIRVRIPIDAYDFVNDLIPRVRLLSRGGEVLAEAVGDGDPRHPVALTYLTPPGERSNRPRRYIVEVSDAPGPGIAEGAVHRVLVPSRYDLSLNVSGPPSTPHDDGPVVRDTEDDDFTFARLGANPSRGPVTFRYVIPRSGQETPVRLCIYDVSGRAVHTLVAANQTPGSYSVSWAGHDANGRRVASGAYFARFEAGLFARTVRLEVIH